MKCTVCGAELKEWDRVMVVNHPSAYRLLKYAETGLAGARSIG